MADDFKLKKIIVTDCNEDAEEFGTDGVFVMAQREHGALLARAKKLGLTPEEYVRRTYKAAGMDVSRDFSFELAR